MILPALLKYVFYLNRALLIALKTLGMTGKFGKKTPMYVGFQSLLALLVMFLLVSPTLIGQGSSTNYRIVKVFGKVSLATKKEPLQRNQKIQRNEPLRFGSLQDMVVVIDEKGGAFLLLPQQTLQQFKVKPLTFGVSTRPGRILNDLQLRQYFVENDSLLLIDGKFSLVLGNAAFPMNEERFFYLEYNWKGQKIAKKLGYRGDTLIIDAKELYKVDGVPIDRAEVLQNYHLYYRNAKTKESVAYPDLKQPIFIFEAKAVDFQEELKLVLGNVAQQSYQEKYAKIDAYLRTFYGRVGAKELEKLLTLTN